MLTRRGRVENRYRRDLALAVASLASGVRSGRPLVDALGDVSEEIGGDVGREWAEVCNRARRGVPLADALAALIHLDGRVEVRLFVGAMSLGVHTGGRMADALDGVSSAISVRAELWAEQQALASQARASARLLAVAPVVFGIAAVVLDSRIAEFILGSVAGWSVVAVATVLNGLGWVWMERMLRWR